MLGPPTAALPNSIPAGRFTPPDENESPRACTVKDLKFTEKAASKGRSTVLPLRDGGERYVPNVLLAAAGLAGHVKERTGEGMREAAPYSTPDILPVTGSLFRRAVGLMRGRVMMKGFFSPVTERGLEFVGDSRFTVVTRVSEVRLGRRS